MASVLLVIGQCLHLSSQFLRVYRCLHKACAYLDVEFTDNLQMIYRCDDSCLATEQCKNLLDPQGRNQMYQKGRSQEHCSTVLDVYAYEMQTLNRISAL